MSDRSRRTGASARPRRCAASTATPRWCSRASTGRDARCRTRSRRSATTSPDARARCGSRSVDARRVRPGRQDRRVRPRAGRVDRPPDHAPPAHHRLRQRGGRVAAADRGRRRHPRHVPRAVDHRFAHRRVDLLAQPHDRPGPRPGHRLQPVRRLPLPGGAARGLRPAHRGRAHRRDAPGRTVAFSALTVAVSLSALLVFPLSFLRSFAYAGIAVVLVAALASIVALPALLAVLGTRVDAWRVFRRTPQPGGLGLLAPHGHAA